MVPVKSMIGLRFGAIVVLSREPSSSAGAAYWRCRCDCGTVFNRSGGDIRRQAESNRCRNCFAKATANLKRTHGESDTYFHILWLGIRRRCRNTNYPRYGDWGGRGIRVIDSWYDDYLRFKSDVIEEIGPRPSDQHTLDRIENDGHYEPGNIQWATPSQQALNQREKGSGVIANKTGTRKKRGRPRKTDYRDLAKDVIERYPEVMAHLAK